MFWVSGGVRLGTCDTRVKGCVVWKCVVRRLGCVRAYVRVRGGADGGLTMRACVCVCVCVCVCGLMYVHIITSCDVTSRHHVPHETSRHHHRIKSGHSVIIPFDTLHRIASHRITS